MIYLILQKKVSGQVVISEGGFSPPRPWGSEKLLWKGTAESQDDALTRAKEEGKLEGIPDHLLPYT